VRQNPRCKDVTTGTQRGKAHATAPGERARHRASPRSFKPLLRSDCASLSVALRRKQDRKDVAHAAQVLHRSETALSVQPVGKLQA
jgi:hypothetical protein